MFVYIYIIYLILGFNTYKLSVIIMGESNGRSKFMKYLLSYNYDDL
jgi:hypothetical protein